MIIKVLIEKNKDGFWAYAENVKSIVGYGDTLYDCKKNISDCIETLKETNNCPKELKTKYKLSYQLI